MNANQWVTQFSIAFAAKGATLSDSSRRFLLSPLPERRTHAQIETIAKAKTMMTALLFQRANGGSVFGELARVQHQFGRTLEENYGLTSGPFLAFARAFWTFKIEVNDLLPDHLDLLLTQVLMAVEEEVAGVFFPTPGPFLIPAEKRREAQRLFLAEYAPDFDVDRFLDESPILQPELRRQKTGCLGLALALALAVIATGGGLD
jgi:hypothetical protein